MLTQLYNDKINELTPQLLPTVELRAVAPVPPTGVPESVPPPSPTYPTPAPSPWVTARKRKPTGFNGMVLGVLSAAAVLGGLALFSMAFVYGSALSAFAYLALLVVGGYFIALGAAYVTAAKPETA